MATFQGIICKRDTRKENKPSLTAAPKPFRGEFFIIFGEYIIDSYTDLPRHGKECEYYPFTIQDWARLLPREELWMGQALL